MIKFSGFVTTLVGILLIAGGILRMVSYGSDLNALDDIASILMIAAGALVLAYVNYTFKFIDRYLHEEGMDDILDYEEED